MTVTAIQSNWTGRIIDGRFTLLQWLGGSGHSGVFLTEAPGNPPQKAAIKIMPAEAGLPLVANAGRDHSHLLRILESGRCEVDGSPFVFVVSEFADEVLSEILLIRPLSPDEVKEMLVPVLDALTRIHEQGLVHGRLKPSNILVTGDQLKLSADSLQPASAAPDASPTHSVPVLSVPVLNVFDAPERANGTLSPASDLWSLGATIVESLTQRAPEWNRAANRDVQVPDSLPHPLAEIAAACLRVDPARRATLNDVRKSLGLALPAHAVKAVPMPVFNAAPPSAPKVDERSYTDNVGKSPSKSRFGVLVIALLVLGAAALLWMYTHGAKPAAQADDQQSAPAQLTTEPQPQATQPTTEPVQQPPANAAPTPPAAPAPAQPVQAGTGATKGAVSQRVMPDILPAATQSIQGKVNVRVRVNVGPNGDVTDAAIESSGPSKYFARAALEAARKWKFTPAQSNGQPVASVWTLQFVFTRDNTEITPEQTIP